MNPLELLAQHTAIHTFGWTLLHLLWQGIIIALLLHCALSLMRKRSANTRYLAACVALLLMSLCPVITFFILNPALPAAMPIPSLSSVPVAAMPELQDTSLLPTALSEDHDVSLVAGLLPTLVGGWLVGVAVLSLRMFGGWVLLQRLAKRNAPPVADELCSRIEAMARQMGLRRPVRLLTSA